MTLVYFLHAAESLKLFSTPRTHKQAASFGVLPEMIRVEFWYVERVPVSET